MNPLATLSDTAKLVLSLLALALVALVVWWFSGLLGAKAQIKEIRATDKRIAAAHKTADGEARARDRATDAQAAQITTRADALAKELSHADAVFDARAAGEYFRLLNDALRGTER